MKDRIEYIDLLYSIYSVLKAEYPDKTKTDISISKKNKEVDKPRFYIDIRPLNTNSYRDYDVELVNVTISYTDVIMNQEKTLSIKSIFNELFNEGIWGEGVFVYFENKSFSGNDDCIDFNFTINYFYAKSERNIDANDKYSEMMNELEFDTLLNVKE